MKWYNKPRQWSDKNGLIKAKVDSGTDYWQVTHYGFARDNGHFYYTEIEGDFVASVKVTGDYKELYDQAGLMIRIDEKNWIKTGIEFVGEIQNVSAVVTRDFSDWSVCPYGNAPKTIYLKLIRQKDFVEIQYSFDNVSFKMLRLAYFPPNVPVMIGIMCAAPDGKGFEVVFEDFLIEIDT
jgi:uncharacterized protein